MVPCKNLIGPTPRRTGADGGQRGAKVRNLKSRVTGAIWDVDLAALPIWAGWLVRLVRILYAVVRDLADGMLSLRAMSLVYTTLLSLVPLLAISFSVLKGFGVHNQIEPLLLNFMAPMGEKGVEITERIISCATSSRTSRPASSARRASGFSSTR